MTLYKGIQGFSVQNLSADPTDPNEGQLWYNSTSNVWKLTSATTAGTWATGGNLNTTRRALAGCGIQTAALAFSGFNSTATEEYDGASWTSSNPVNTGRESLAGAGTQTAGLTFGGETPGGVTAATEEYNGN
jgi:hypothetical protein